MGLPGKPEGIDSNEVERYFLEGRVKEIAEYCETDVVNTYRVWLRYELFRGRLSESEHQASERCLADFIRRRVKTASQSPRASEVPPPKPGVPEDLHQASTPPGRASIDTWVVGPISTRHARLTSAGWVCVSVALRLAMSALGQTGH
jgi:hypothetical protein